MVVNLWEERDPSVSQRKLTIGMATYDDYDGVYFTMQAIRLYHPEITQDTELLIVDNHPEGPAAEPLRRLADSMEGCRYVAYSETRGTSPPRNQIFREAQTPLVMVVDCHVMFAPGSLQRLLDFSDTYPQCFDLLQGPLLSDDLRDSFTHFDPSWAAAMYGHWGTDERGIDPDGEPFEIPMQGLGVFACRREAWLGFNPRFRGFGGEEGYIHEKFRQAGRRVMCLPFLRWTHRFDRPSGVPFVNTLEDRFRNYMIGWTELGLDTAPIEQHFRDEEGFEPILQAIEGDLTNPFWYFDAIYCISDKNYQMEHQFEVLDIAPRIRWLPAHGEGLSHRVILEDAQGAGLENVLIFDNTLKPCGEGLLRHIALSVEGLNRLDWRLFRCHGGVGYHKAIFQQVLDGLPDSESLPAWRTRYRSLGEYLSRVMNRLDPGGHGGQVVEIREF